MYSKRQSHSLVGDITYYGVGCRSHVHILPSDLLRPWTDYLEDIVSRRRCIVFHVRRLPPRRNVVHLTQGTLEGQGDAHLDAVRSLRPGLSSQSRRLTTCNSGLDNAGKTTIVKRMLGEDIRTVSPTLGFNIRTIDYEGSGLPSARAIDLILPSLQLQIEHL